MYPLIKKGDETRQPFSISGFFVSRKRSVFINVIHFRSPRHSAHAHPHAPHTLPITMAITYDTAMQVYFGMYAATMTTFPDE